MEKMGREEFVAMYRPDVERLVLYLPWLREKTGKDVTNMYRTQDSRQTLAFPVYDSTLLNFINELGSTVFMNQNYRYIYTRYRMHDVQDELKCIAKANIMTMDILCGIFSRYALGGMTKAYLWTQGVEEKIFLTALEKAKEIIEFWDGPIYVPSLEEESAAEEYMTEEFAGEDAAEEVELFGEEVTEETGLFGEEVTEETASASQEEAEAETSAVAEVELVSETEPEATEPEEPEESETEAEAEPEPEESVENETEAKAEPEPEPVGEPESEPVSEESGAAEEQPEEQPEEQGDV